jgi:hypothetical protein
MDISPDKFNDLIGIGAGPKRAANPAVCKAGRSLWGMMPPFQTQDIIGAFFLYQVHDSGLAPYWLSY